MRYTTSAAAVHVATNDGSAETPHEAILKHGGEAEFAQKNFVALPDARKHQLIEFLRSL